MATTYNDTPESKQKYAGMKDGLKKSGEELSESMKGPQEEVSREAKRQTENVTNYAAEEMEDLSHAAEATAQALSDEHHEKLSSYVSDIAGYVGNMATSLRHKSADDLMNDAKRLARDNPTLFIAGGLALGLGISRLAKSGGEAHESSSKNTAPLSERSGSFDSRSTSSAQGRGNIGDTNVGGSFSSSGGAGLGSSTTHNMQPQSPDSSFSNKSNPRDNF